MIYFFTNVILTDNPQFYGSGETLSNILVIGLFHSDNRIVVFFKTTTKNSYPSKHVNGLELQAIQLLQALVASSTARQILFHCI